MNSQKILCFGEIMLRLGAPKGMRLGQNLPGNLEATFGGSEASVAASLATYGTKSSYTTALPPGPLTNAFVAELKGMGVEVVIANAPQSRFGIYFVEQGTGLRGGVVHYDRGGSGVSESCFSDYSFHALLSGVTGLHVSGITAAISEKACLTLIEVVRLAKEKNIFVSCDLNYRAKLWQWGGSVTGTALARKWMPRVIEHVDLVVGNESDFADALGIYPPTSKPDAGIVHAEEYGVLCKLVCEQFSNVKYVSSSLRTSISAEVNHWGGVLYEAKTGSAFFAPALNGDFMPYELHIFDRFGAGDAFVGGLLHALNSQDLKTPEDAIAFAVAAGALKHTIHGDYNRVSKEEVLRLMQGDQAGRVQR